MTETTSPAGMEVTTQLVARGVASSHRPRRSVPLSFLVTVVLFAAGLRFAAAVGPLWLDEIWSLELARQATTAAAVFTDLDTDNNHLLNTLYLRAAGTGWPPWVYRLPAIVCGTASVVVGGSIAARWGSTESVIATTLLASSYLLVHYSSEARGYAPALLFVLLGWESLWRWMEAPRCATILVFWGSCCLGTLSHPIFFHFLAAAGCWSISANFSRTHDLPTTLRRQLLLFLLPLVLAVVVYWISWREIQLGGGPPYSLRSVLIRTGSLAVGGPISGWGSVMAVMLLVAAIGAAIWRLRGDRMHSGLMLSLLLLAPLAQLSAVRAPFLFPRYFLTAVICVPLVLALVLADLHRRGRWARWATSGLLLTLILANLLPTAALVTVGRGQYLAALHFLASATGDPVVAISGDHNFGLRKLIDFYAPQVRPRREIRYVNGDQWPASGPQWLILHRDADATSPALRERLAVDGLSFQLQRVFDCSILSGWQWWCYRRTSVGTETMPTESTDQVRSAWRVGHLGP